MKTQESPVLSVVVPLYNEEASLPDFYTSLRRVLTTLDLSYEVIFVDDGSTDRSNDLLAQYAKEDAFIRILSFSRNFGKEIATTAGIHQAHGEAILTIDADGQHPVGQIPLFVDKWRRGAKVVLGRRTSRHDHGMKHLGTALFYKLFRRFTGTKLESNTTDYRLIDRDVQRQFNTLTEHNRITRGLIDWVGYDREYVDYAENQRLAGAPTYSLRKLSKLAIDSAISHSYSPLYLAAYLGAIILPLSVLLGLIMVVNFAFGDPLRFHATAGAYLIVLVLFLVGILLISQGIIGLYLSRIHAETQNRPLYIIDAAKSKGV